MILRKKNRYLKLTEINQKIVKSVKNRNTVLILLHVTFTYEMG